MLATSTCPRGNHEASGDLDVEAMTFTSSGGGSESGSTNTPADPCSEIHHDIGEVLINQLIILI